MENNIYFMAIRIWKSGRQGFSRKLVIAAKPKGTWVQTFSLHPSYEMYQHVVGVHMRQEPYENPTPREIRLAKEELDGEGSPDWVVIV